MEIIIKESHLQFLVEIAAFNKTLPPSALAKIEGNPILKRCYRSKANKNPDSVWCRLVSVFEEKLDNPLKERLVNAVKVLLSVYKKKYDTGVVSKIIELSLQDETRTVNDLELIADFLTNEEFSNEAIKKQLIKLQSSSSMPTTEELEILLKNARFKEYTQYENSLDGEQFGPFKTKLEIDYRCDESLDQKFFTLIKDLQIAGKTKNKEEFEVIIDSFVKSFTNCIKESMDSIQDPIKSDKILKEDLYIIDENNEKIKVLDKGYYEVKKFDPYIDSYLSEFFAVFKDSSLKQLKERFLATYNHIIQKIFNWITENGQDFLDKIKQNMKGIIFKDNLIIPTEYIELYWSNRGQHGCKEKRISIRYRLNRKIEKIKGYTYTLNSNIVKENNNLSSLDLSPDKLICP